MTMQDVHEAEPAQFDESVYVVPAGEGLLDEQLSPQIAGVAA